MSYTRWSTDINNVLPWEEYIAMLKDSQDLDSLRQEQIKRGAEWSDWYIYWHCESRDTKDTQLLAIWQAKGTTPVLDYETVKDLFERDAWEETFENVTQRDHLTACVKSWLQDVEEEYPES